MKHALRVLACGLISLLFTVDLPAATRHWDGGGTSGFWDTAANWSNNVAPVNGDTLFFPTNSARLTSTNRPASNLTNLSAIRFTGDGYEVFSGPAINLTNGLTNNGLFGSINTLNAALQLRQSQTWTVGGRTTLNLNSNVALNGFSLTNDLPGPLIANGNWTGNGQLIKTGTSRLELNGPANSIPTVRVLDGTLQVDGALAAATSFVISNGATLIGSGTVSAFACAGDFSPGTVSAPGLMTVSGAGNVSFGPGARFFANLNGLTPGTDYDQLKVANPLNLAGANLSVVRSLTFSFSLGQKFTIITNTGGAAQSSTFANLAANGRITNNGVVFQINYAGGSGNDVELTVVDAPFVATGTTRIWDGGGNNGLFSNPANWVGDAAPQDGDSLQFPADLPAPDNVATNDLAFRFNQLIATGLGSGFGLHGQSMVLGGGIVATQSGGAFFIGNSLSFIGGGQIQVGQTNLILLSSITNGGGDITISGGTGRVIFNGVIRGAGGLSVDCGGVELSNGNTYTGVTRFLRGSVLLGAPASLGDETSGPTFVASGAFVNIGATRLFESSIVLTGRMAFGAPITSNVVTAFEFVGPDASFVATPGSPVRCFGPWTGSGSVELNNGDFFLAAGHSVSGGITVQNRARLFVDGSGVSDINLGFSNGTLGGTGQVGRVTTAANGRGRLTPGASPGALITGDLTFNGVTTNTFELNGLVPGTSYDQLRVTGGVSLNNARLDVVAGFTASAGHTFTLIDNDGNDPVVGTYAGLPEGALVAGSGQAFRISYAGGTGNDVVLTATEGAFVPSGNTRVWTGGSGTFGSRNWSISANWDGGFVPARGDRLVFPAAAPVNTRINVHNLAETNAVFEHIAFGGEGNTWIVQGNGLKLFGGVIATNDFLPGNASFGNARIELIGSQSWNCTNSTLAQNAPLLLGGHTLTLASGEGGAVSLQNSVLGPGALVMSAGGVFLFAQTGISNVPVTIGGARVFAGSGTHSGPAWQMSSGELRLGPTRFPGLTMTGGTLDLSMEAAATNSGDLTLSAACVVRSDFDFNGAQAPPSVVVVGQVNLAGARLAVGTVDLSLLNTPIVLIQKLSPGPILGTFAGIPEGGTISGTNEFSQLVTRYRVSYVGGDGNDVTFTPVAPAATGIARVWTGAGSDSQWSTLPNWTANTPPSAGDRVVFPVNAARRDNTNPSPALVLDRIDWTGSNYHHAGVLTLLGGLNHAAASGTNVLAIAPVLATLGSQTWSVSNATSLLRITEETDEGFGEILGIGPVTKTGAGALELAKLTVRATGGLIIDGGTARLNDANLDNHAPLILQRGRIEANDVGVQTLVATNGELAVFFSFRDGDEQVSGGISSADPVALSSNLLLTVHWTNGASAALTAPQLDLNDAQLNVVIPSNLPVGEVIRVAQYFQDSRTGFFAQLPDGAVTNFGGRAWQIHYDVEIPEEFFENRFITLTTPIVAPIFTRIERLPSGDVILRGTAPAGAAVAFEASEFLDGFVGIGSAVANGAGEFSFLDANPGGSSRFYRAFVGP